MRGDECDGEVSASEAHGVILRFPAIRKKLGLTRKWETQFVQIMFADGPGDDGIDFPSQSEVSGIFECFPGSFGAVFIGVARVARAPKQGDIDSTRKLIQSGIDDFGTNARRVAKGDGHAHIMRVTGRL